MTEIDWKAVSPSKSNELCKFEIEILRECAGQKTPSQWGAADGAALDVLRDRGLVTRQGEITPAGRDYLDRLRR